MSVFSSASPGTDFGPELDFGQGRWTPSDNRRRLVLALGASLALAACGKKGELELPPPDAAPADEQAGGDRQ